jgi:hypothetical protein
MRGKSLALTCHQYFEELYSTYPEYTVAYNDGSFVEGSTHYASVHEDQVFSYYPHSFNSIYVYIA